MTRHTVDHFAIRDQRRPLVLEPVALRIPDRSSGAFGEGRRERLSFPGRPSCLFADTIVTVARVRAGEDAQ
jgi:hypothetical protein